MRVLEAIQTLDQRVGGPCRAVLDLSEVLAERGHEVAVLAATGPDVPTAWLQSEENQAERLPRAQLCSAYRWPFPPAVFRRLAARLVREAEVVHLHGVWEPFNLVVSAMARRYHVPYVVTLRGMLDDWSMLKSRAKKRVYLTLAGQRMLESAAYVHCTAQAELKQSSKWFPRGTGRVIPNLLNLEPYSTPKDGSLACATFPVLATRSAVLLFLGRVSPKKGVEHLLEAVWKLRADGLDVVAVVAGDLADLRYAESLRAQVARLGIGSHVHFLGHVTGEVKVSLLRAARLLVVPTSQENFGFVFYESLAAGTPVVTTDLVDTAEELAGSGGGFIVPQSADAIASCIRRLLTAEGRIEASGRAAREWIFREMATPLVAGQYEQMFRDAIEGPSRGK